MAPESSIQHPQASAGRCQAAMKGQRQLRKPPKMTKLVKPKCTTTSASARRDHSIARPVSSALCGDALHEQAADAGQRLLERLHAAGKREPHMVGRAEARARYHGDAGIIQQQLRELV